MLPNPAIWGIAPLIAPPILSVVGIKYSDQKQIIGEGLFLASSFKTQFIMEESEGRNVKAGPIAIPHHVTPIREPISQPRKSGRYHGGSCCLACRHVYV